MFGNIHRKTAKWPFIFNHQTADVWRRCAAVRMCASSCGARSWVLSGAALLRRSLKKQQSDASFLEEPQKAGDQSVVRLPGCLQSSFQEPPQRNLMSIYMETVTWAYSVKHGFHSISRCMNRKASLTKEKKMETGNAPKSEIFKQ